MRLCIVGNGGTGKTTLALRLGPLLGLPVVHTDTLLWREGWQPVPHDDYLAAIDEVTARPAWLVDGLGPLESCLTRASRSTEIIFHDYPFDLALRWTQQRIAAHGDTPRAELPAGCLDGKVAIQMLTLVRKVHLEQMPILRDHLAALATRIPVHRLRSPAETADLLAHVEAHRALPPAAPFDRP